jgi:hypothetical protein
MKIYLNLKNNFFSETTKILTQKLQFYFQDKIVQPTLKDRK